MTIGVDLSERIERLVLLDRAGHVRARAEAVADAHGSGVVHALRRLVDGARPTGAAVAMPLPGAAVPAELAAALVAAMPRSATVHGVGAGTALALAEVGLSLPDASKSVVGLAVGQHVSAGLLIDGQPWLGAHGLAGSVGWLALNPVERDDYRRFGGLEAEIAEAGIVRRFVWRAKSGDHSAVSDQVNGDFARVTSAMIFAGARAGDGVCISIVRDTVRYLGMAIANLVTVVDPASLALGGAIVAAADLLLEPLRTECMRRVRPEQAERLSISVASRGDDAVAIGAARAAALRPA